ncbi:hypothetical protein Ddye_022785, partial [Dipteronia dyeriana]
NEVLEYMNKAEIVIKRLLEVLLKGLNNVSDFDKAKEYALMISVDSSYVRQVNGDTWIHVPPIDRALVINVGDVLQIISNEQEQGFESLFSVS